MAPRKPLGSASSSVCSNCNKNKKSNLLAFFFALVFFARLFHFKQQRVRENPEPYNAGRMPVPVDMLYATLAAVSAVHKVASVMFFGLCVAVIIFC